MQPVGTVTFLFTDIEGSTWLWEQYPQSMGPSLARHDAILREAIESHHGFVVKMTGDGVHAAFSTAGDALLATISAQLDLVAEPWPQAQPLRVRAALHTGQAEWREGDYYGSAVNRAARIMSVAAGGQVLLSAVTAELVRDLLPEGTKLRNLGQHRLRSLDRPERIYQLSHPDLLSDFPPLKSSVAIPNNLPAQLTSFIGREKELAEVRRLLISETPEADGYPAISPHRLVTLTGPGGTGKTRLSQEVAGQTLDYFPDGVWLVELAPITEQGLVVQAVATALGLQEQPGRPLSAMLISYLGRRKLLLILDNCEHLIDACALLAGELLQSCPNLTILASSREALGIAGEQAYRVRSLALPTDGKELSFEELAGFAAIRLFVDRAEAVKPEFALKPDNAPAVLQICQRLDGIPLAIELAAARVRVLSPDQIAARLDDRFRLLTGGSRTALPRQRTLQALIDWSYDLLSEPECILLRRLAVFSGSWTLEAAEVITGTEPIKAYDVLDLIEQLVNKSLVVAEETDWGLRYRMLETVRQYAQEKLAAENEAFEVRDRHLAYFVEQIRLAENAMIELNHETFNENLAAEADNLRSAQAWSLEHDLIAALKMASIGTSQIFIVLPRAETLRYIETVLDKVKNRQDFFDPNAPAENRHLLGSALVSAAIASLGLGMNPQTLDYARRAGELLENMDDLQMLASARGMAAITSFLMGDLAAANKFSQEASSLARQSGNRWVLAMSTLPLAGPMNGDPEAVWVAWEQAMSIFRESRYLWGLGMGHQIAAQILMYGGEFEAAQTHAEQSLDLFNEIGDMHMSNVPRSILAETARRQGDFDEATDLYRQAALVWRDKGNFGGLARCLECLAFIEHARMKVTETLNTERLRHAIALLGAAVTIRQHSQSPMTALEESGYEAEIAMIRQATGDSVFLTAYQQGQRMTMDQAIIFALEA
jgi:predicted ATPase/class 3 adenylate cyclase